MKTVGFRLIAATAWLAVFAILPFALGGAGTSVGIPQSIAITPAMNPATTATVVFGPNVGDYTTDSTVHDNNGVAGSGKWSGRVNPLNLFAGFAGNPITYNFTTIKAALDNTRDTAQALAVASAKYIIFARSPATQFTIVKVIDLPTASITLVNAAPTVITWTVSDSYTMVPGATYYAGVFIKGTAAAGAAPRLHASATNGYYAPTGSFAAVDILATQTMAVGNTLTITETPVSTQLSEITVTTHSRLVCNITGPVVTAGGNGAVLLPAITDKRSVVRVRNATLGGTAPTASEDCYFQLYHYDASAASSADTRAIRLRFRMSNTAAANDAVYFEQQSASVPLNGNNESGCVFDILFSFGGPAFDKMRPLWINRTRGQGYMGGNAGVEGQGGDFCMKSWFSEQARAGTDWSNGVPIVRGGSQAPLLASSARILNFDMGANSKVGNTATGYYPADNTIEVGWEPVILFGESQLGGTSSGNNVANLGQGIHDALAADTQIGPAMVICAGIGGNRIDADIFDTSGIAESAGIIRYDGSPLDNYNGMDAGSNTYTWGRMGLPKINTLSGDWFAPTTLAAGNGQTSGANLIWESSLPARYMGAPISIAYTVTGASYGCAVTSHAITLTIPTGQTATQVRNAFMNHVSDSGGPWDTAKALVNCTVADSGAGVVKTMAARYLKPPAGDFCEIDGAVMMIALYATNTVWAEIDSDTDGALKANVCMGKVIEATDRILRRSRMYAATNASVTSQPLVQKVVLIGLPPLGITYTTTANVTARGPFYRSLNKALNGLAVGYGIAYYSPYLDCADPATLGNACPAIKSGYSTDDLHLDAAPAKAAIAPKIVAALKVSFVTPAMPN